MTTVAPAPVVLVTGAAGGLGRAIGERFDQGGWRVVGTDRPEVEPVRESWIPADLRDVSACSAVVRRAHESMGRLDAVVNAAGVWTEGPAEATTEEEWDRVLDINLKGLYFVTAAAIPYLAESGGCVVNISSDAGIQGNAGAAVYCASKGGVSNLTRALALELAPRGVRVNAVCPGDIDTPMLHGQARDYGNGDPAAYLRSLLDSYPQRERARFARADEIAAVVWFLAQPEAAAVTGANWSVDFGLSAGV